MLTLAPVVITSVQPLEGHEGTIVTLRGSGFAGHVRNNCVLIGGLGACARPEPDSTDTELKVRIGPVAREAEGDVLLWPGIGLDLHTESINYGEARLLFSETAIFRNGAPGTLAGVNFKLTRVSPNTYGGSIERPATSRVELGGHENGSVMRVPFPGSLSLSNYRTIDICLVLKEPTLAIDFTAEITDRERDAEEILRVIAKTISVNAGLVGEQVFTDVVRNRETGELELYVTKPYLEKGMFTVHFNSGASRGVAV
jgi:hypothetical protein